MLPLPLYVCGLAKIGKDGPFHALESLSGAQAASAMLALGVQGLKQPRSFLMPHLCPLAIAEHEGHGDKCTHDKQCASNTSMWRHPTGKISDAAARELSIGRSTHYAGDLSDGLAQHLISFFVGDTEQLRQGLTSILKSHGDLILQRWKNLSVERKGKLLVRVSERVFGVWPAVVCGCSTMGCEEAEAPSWKGGHWLNTTDLAEDS